MTGGKSAGTLRVFEHKSGVETYLTHQGERLLEVFFGFVVIAHKDIGRDAAAGDNAADGIYLLQIILAGVFAVHQFQYPVAAALGGEMYMAAEIRLLGNGMEDVFGHILGIGGGETHAHLGYFTGYEVKELGEGSLGVG